MYRQNEPPLHTGAARRAGEWRGIHGYKASALAVTPFERSASKERMKPQWERFQGDGDSVTT